MLSFFNRCVCTSSGAGYGCVANFVHLRREHLLAANRLPLGAVDSSTEVFRKETREMKRLSILLALVSFILPSAGCGCCGCFRHPTPVAAPCPPPAPVCDPCTTAPVTYGGAPVPVAPYTPPPQF
jgi:hypothetical protein